MPLAVPLFKSGGEPRMAKAKNEQRKANSEGVVTMSILRFDPFGDFVTTGRWVPAVDIYETQKDGLVLKAELPDMKREDISVVVENSTLTLKGERKFDGEARKEQFHRVERAYGSFSRSFRLPQTVDAAKIAAEYKNGVLTVTLPVRAESRPRTINVEVAA
jgi:HSP20 family protein